MYLFLQNTNEYTPAALFGDGRVKNVTYIQGEYITYSWKSWFDAPTEGVQGSDVITFDTDESYGEVPMLVCYRKKCLNNA